MMFDDPTQPVVSGYGSGNDLATAWHSEPCNLNQANCIITINFNNKIDFHQLTIVKQQLDPSSAAEEGFENDAFNFREFYERDDVTSLEHHF